MTLKRKLHIVESPLGVTAVAFAGDGKHIGTCLETLRWNIADWEKSDRPMRKFGDNVNLYEGRVEAIAVYAPNSGEFNSVWRSAPFSLEQYGLCAAIGSGENDLTELLDLANVQINSKTHPVQKISMLAHSVNGNRLAKEYLSRNSNNWGGFVEYCYFDLATGKWIRGESSLNILCMIKPKDKNVQVSVVPRVIAYDPRGENPCVLSMSICGGSELWAQFFLTEQDAAVASEKLWVGWRPETVTITYIVDGERMRGYFTDAIFKEIDQYVQFEIATQGTMRLEIDKDYLKAGALRVLNHRNS